MWQATYRYTYRIISIYGHESMTSLQISHIGNFFSYGATAQVGLWPPHLKFRRPNLIETRGRTPLDE
jgi:hypothetical protein